MLEDWSDIPGICKIFVFKVFVPFMSTLKPLAKSEENQKDLLIFVFPDSLHRCVASSDELFDWRSSRTPCMKNTSKTPLPSIHCSILHFFSAKPFFILPSPKLFQSARGSCGSCGQQWVYFWEGCLPFLIPFCASS